MTPNNEKSKNSSDDNDTYDSLLLRRIAAVLGSSGVALGAMGAHALKSTLEARKATAMWQTASSYQLFHAVAVLGLAAMCNTNKLGGTDAFSTMNTNKKDDDNIRSSSTDSGSNNNKNNSSKIVLAAKMMAVGTMMFSGSIYCLALNVGPKKVLGPTTPLGGLILIGGWIVAGL